MLGLNKAVNNCTMENIEMTYEQTSFEIPLSLNKGGNKGAINENPIEAKKFKQAK